MTYEEFISLADEWYATRDSLEQDFFKHPAYLEILALGKPGIAYILKDWSEAGDVDIKPWFSTLIKWTEENPVTQEDSVSLVKMRDAWIKWCVEAGYETYSV